jgi:hypothetical protein
MLGVDPRLVRADLKKSSQALFSELSPWLEIIGIASALVANPPLRSKSS